MCHARLRDQERDSFIASDFRCKRGFFDKTQENGRKLRNIVGSTRCVGTAGRPHVRGMQNSERHLPRYRMQPLYRCMCRLDQGVATAIAALIAAAGVIAAAWIGLLAQVAVTIIERISPARRR
jgi:hypothetical protein